MNKVCIVCGAPLMDTALLECSNMPAAAQHLPTSSDLSQDRSMDLRLCQCSGCGLVQLDVEPVDYYQDVIRSGGYSTTMHDLRFDQYTKLLDTCPLTGKRIIEIGCGQGEFLRVWRDDHFPVKAYGIEHDPSLVEKALADGLSVDIGFAENEHTIIAGAPYDAFCSFNFLEHQPNPNGMLRCIYNNLADTAYGLITVPSLEYILEKECYYELIRDHIAYYSQDAFRFVLEKNGFRVLSMRVVNRDTWEAIVEKRPLIATSALRDNQAKLRAQIHAVIDEISASGGSIAVWGASHQGLTILSSLSLNNKVKYVIDSAPFKQGKYTTGSHIPIVAPEHFHDDPVQAIIIIAPGYTDEIAWIIHERFSKTVQIYSLRGSRLEKF